MLSTLRNERDHATLMALVKKSVDLKDEVEIKYASLLTPYALRFVSRQLSLREKVNVVHESTTDCQVSSSEGILQVTTHQCQYKFWKSTHLPCRHIFAVRERRELSLFAHDIVAERWTLNYMKKAHDEKLLMINASSFQVLKV